MSVRFRLFDFKKCTSCSHTFILFSPSKCEICGKDFCDKCSSVFKLGFKYASIEMLPHWDHNGKTLCKKCSEKLTNSKEFLDFSRRYENARKNSTNVRVYPKSYKGKISLDTSVAPKECNTPFYADRSEVEFSLQVWACLHDYDVIYNLQYIRDTAHSGNYVYSVYKGTCNMAKMDNEDKRPRHVIKT